MTDNKGKIMNATDVFDVVREHREEMAKKLYIADDNYVINIRYEYNIPRSECSTIPELLHWVHHITEKTWMEIPVLRKFIELVKADQKLTF